MNKNDKYPFVGELETSNMKNPPSIPHRSEVVCEDSFLGQQLRSARIGKGLSLKDASEMAGISLGQLSQIERGLSSPSVRALRELCKILEKEMHELFSDSPVEPGRIIRVNERKSLNFGDRGMVKQFMTSEQSSNLQMMEVILQPDGGTGAEPYTHQGEECGVVIQGRIEIVVDGEQHLLGEGDSFYFKSTLPHMFRNVGYGKAKIIWVTTPAVW